MCITAPSSAIMSREYHTVSNSRMFIEYAIDGSNTPLNGILSIRKPQPVREAPVWTIMSGAGAPSVWGIEMSVTHLQRLSLLSLSSSKGESRSCLLKYLRMLFVSDIISLTTGSQRLIQLH
ncbi:unnamed protein product [Meganyctiphanes norvegica]|uniref:Uncharacterized protein n=1 Tax=Meganyctiphanes norvegica TaxID=48144 RepID=A0AAV2SF56_MEGNR